MKKIFFIVILTCTILLIYKTNDKSIDYMDIGDSLSLGINAYGNKTYSYSEYIKNYLENKHFLHSYNNYFSKVNYKIDELNNDITNNKSIIVNNKSYNIKKELRESDILTISIGMDELIELLYNHKLDSIDNLINSMDNLIKNIKNYAKSKIVLIGYYNPLENNKENERIFANINDKYSIIAKKYNIIYVDIYNIIDSNKTVLPNKFDYHITSKGYLKISNKIIEKALN